MLTRNAGANMFFKHDADRPEGLKGKWFGGRKAEPEEDAPPERASVVRSATRKVNQRAALAVGDDPELTARPAPALPTSLA